LPTSLITALESSSSPIVDREPRRRLELILSGIDTVLGR
jgi:hypothetical protein